jgi:hypothetical protein
LLQSFPVYIANIDKWSASDYAVSLIMYLSVVVFSLRMMI